MTEREAIVAWLDRRIAKMDADLTQKNAPYIAQAISVILARRSLDILTVTYSFFMIDP